MSKVTQPLSDRAVVKSDSLEPISVATVRSTLANTEKTAGLSPSYLVLHKHSTAEATEPFLGTSFWGIFQGCMESLGLLSRRVLRGEKL